MLRTSLTIVAGMVLAAACGDPAPAPEDPAPPVTLEPVGTIGCAGCDDERQVTPWTLAILDDERIAVLDAFEPFVRVFGTDGDLRLSFGQKGEGPGEFGQELPGFGYFPGLWLFGNELGGVTVIDIFPVSLEVFGADGDFVERRETGLPDAVPTAQAFDAASRSYYRISFSAGPGAADSRRISRCRFSARGAADCHFFADPVPFLQQEGLPDAALGALVLAAGSEGSLVVANSGSYGIWVLDEQGEIVVRSGRDVPLPAKSDAELEAERQRLARAGRPDAQIDPHRPHIQPYGLQLDGDGRIWVLTGRYGDNDSVFDVFTPDGTYLNEVIIDAVVRPTERGLMPFVARGDLLAAAAQQPDGNKQVALYRITVN